MNNSILQKASQQTLCEVLGYDEGRTYYLLLTKNKSNFKKEFSYSKGYRMLKSLFRQGAVGKIKSQDKDFFSYILLPPSFLHFNKVDKKIISFLEEIYLKNFKEFLETDFSQIIVKNEKSLVLFLLKYIMKQSAKIFGSEISLSCLGKNSEKVTINSSETGKRKGIIDKRFSFEFSAIKGRESDDYIGYIMNKEIQ